jgi:hypothetical protein
MANSLQERVGKWFMSMPLGPIIQEANLQVLQLDKALYCEYEPTRGAHPDFSQRADAWLGNFEGDDERQQLLFRLLPKLFFVGPREFDSLYQTAFNHQFAIWLIDQLGVTFDDVDCESKVRAAVSRTWFCPITDSMRINSFYHLNGIEGQGYRPDWLSLARFGSVEKIEKYIKKKRIERIVLLEDFVGNGGQINPGVLFAARLPSSIPVLVVPLVICPAARDFRREIQEAYAHVRIAPVLELPEKEFVSKDPLPDEDELMSRWRGLSAEVADRLRDGLSPDQLRQAKKYIPLGWRGTGALVVLYTNCPNNSLPIIFQKSQSWNAVFPRSARA